jgi:AraC-like DNA-binding protein
MAYFYHTINNDFAIADNVERNYADQWNKLSRMTSTRDMYCVHIVSGTCHLDLNGHIVELHEKDFVVLMQGCFIRTIDHSADLTFFCLVARDQVLRHLFDEVGFYLDTRERINKFYKTSCSDEHHLAQKAHYLAVKRRVLSGSSFDRSIVLRILEMMLLKDMELYWGCHPKALMLPTRKEQVFYDFMKLVEIHFLTERNLLFYATALDLTPKYLSAVIKEISGYHFTYWIDEPLITEAKKMLYYSNKTIKQISQELGFLDQSKFGRFFKNITGMSPKLFRMIEEEE